MANLSRELDGIPYETTADDDLDALPEASRPSAERFIQVAIDLDGRQPSDSNRAASVEILVHGIQDHVAKEKACRVDKKCMAAREAKKAEEAFFAAVVLPMCTADQDREAALAAMAHERANPSGYVNKVFLHDQGAIVQNAQDQLAAAAPAYIKVRHHPWKGWRPECTTPTPP